MPLREYFTLLEKGPQSRNFQKAFSGLRAVGQIVPIDSDRITAWLTMNRMLMRESFSERL